MKKKNLIISLILILFVYGCGYSPIFSNKDSNFSIYELSTSGNSKLNKIISSRLNNYISSDKKKKLSLVIETNLNKITASKDTKGNPKTYRITLMSNVLIKDSKGNTKNKLFSKSLDYNNKSNKSDLKKYENQNSINLAEKISEEIIVFLQSI
tara:strand:+ start:231 stop:689 length:459 start_codon:yes stop_codon:yes gene_type:complete